MKLSRAAWAAGPAALALALVLVGLTPAQDVHRDGFETRESRWVQGPADAQFKEVAHRLMDDHKHSGEQSEYLRLESESGSFIHYLYDIGRAPVTEELTASLWVRANRPGVQLLARLVLPQERNPKQPDEPLTALIRGDTYQRAGRWQCLEIRRAVRLVKEQQQLLRVELQRDINIQGAYFDRLVLNAYPGPGTTEIWIDDLEIGPVENAGPFHMASRERKDRPQGSPEVERPLERRAALIQLKDEKLLVNGKRFFIRGIRHSDTPIKVLRDAGFNTIWFDDSVSPAQLDEAVNLGFWVVPALPNPGLDPKLVSAETVGRRVSQLALQDAVLCWDLGGGLTAEQAPALNRTAEAVRSADRERPLAADVWDGFMPYSRNVQMLGVHRWPLLTALELPMYRDWLNQRRLLAQPGTFLWTWVQTHLPDWYTTMIYDQPGALSFKEPVGPQPEQIKLLAYTAVAAGCKGLGFWSDRFLADSHQGRDRLLEMALVNQELALLEPMLVAADTPGWIDTNVAQVKAAVLRTDRGMLVLPMWVGAGSQYVPGTYVPGHPGGFDLTVVVPQVPIGTQAWEVTPGEVRALKSERVTGGVKVTIPEFGLTSALVFTQDNSKEGLLVHFQQASRNMRKLAAQWTHDLAEAELNKAAKVHAELEQAGHHLQDGEAILTAARNHIKTAADCWNDGAYGESYHEGQRALSAIRSLMRGDWKLAVQGLDTPVASPYAVGFYTLPRHYRFMDEVQARPAGPNVLPGGDFETAPSQPAEMWQAQEVSLDTQYVDLSARRVPEEPRQGKQCLLLEIKARQMPGPDGKVPPPPAALERTFLAVHSPAVNLTPGTLVRISAWVKIPKSITASADGALLYDSAGGEPLAIRLTTEVKQWRKVTLYRRVPQAGTMNVTLALTGIGKVYFDDVRIEPLGADSANVGR